jgi:hypothetical protein
LKENLNKSLLDKIAEQQDRVLKTAELHTGLQLACLERKPALVRASVVIVAGSG